MGKQVVGLIRLVRPSQWTKNALFIFAGFLFSQNFLESFQKQNWNEYLQVLLAFLLFCIASGFVYVINDIADRKTDAKHPEKRKRPIASGIISVPVAWIYAGVLLIIALVGSYFANQDHIGFFFIVLVYIGLNLLYSNWLKHFVLIDILVVAAGFLLRALAGTTVIGVEPSAWLLIFTFSLALLLAASKRRHELQVNIATEGKRKVIAEYSDVLLHQIIGFAATSTLITYFLYTILNTTIHYLWVSTPFVVYGVFRYLYIVYARKEGGNPEKILLKDPHVIITVGLYLISVIAAMIADRYSVLTF
jgi:4-hydroxybenzoate polyprenyltransferase